MDKILFHSNAPWAQTGYGQQTAIFVPRFRELGYDVAISAFWGLVGRAIEVDGIRVYPSDDSWGNRNLPAIAAHWAGGNPRGCQIITLMDVWVLTGRFLDELRVASWCPVDHEPLPPRVREYFERTGATPIAMSRFGERMMQDAGLEPEYVPHGVPTDIYRPCGDVGAVREQLGIPKDAFVVGMVAANKGFSPPRKAFPQALEAFAELRHRHSDAVLYLHTEMTGLYEGVNLHSLVEALGIPTSAVIKAPPFNLEFGISQEAMAHIYSAMDVLLSPSYGEGFGIPIIEAQACGVPVIVNDFSAMPELCHELCWKIGGERYYDPTQGSFYQIPSIPEIADALRCAYDDRGDWTTVREAALDYDADKITRGYWAPLLAKLNAKAEEAPEPPMNRAMRRAQARSHR